MTTDQINKQRKAGMLAFEILEQLSTFIKPGRNVLEIERFAKDKIEASSLTAAFLGFKDYPAVTCVSVNSAIVHGVPFDYQLREGDVLTVDLGVNNDGWLVDTARSYGVGVISEENALLLSVTEEALNAAINACRIGRKVGDIGHIVQTIVEKNNFFIIKELTGHGVGKTLQEPPSVPNFGKPNSGPKLEEGMVIAVEPIVSTHPTKIVVMEDGWTIAAQSDSICAHFEHTIAITKGDPLVLTGKP